METWPMPDFFPCIHPPYISQRPLQSPFTNELMSVTADKAIISVNIHHIGIRHDFRRHARHVRDRFANSLRMCCGKPIEGESVPGNAGGLSRSAIELFGLMRNCSTTRDTLEAGLIGFHIAQGDMVSQADWQRFQHALPPFAFGLIGLTHGAYDTKTYLGGGSAVSLGVSAVCQRASSNISILSRRNCFSPPSWKFRSREGASSHQRCGWLITRKLSLQT